MAASLFFFAFSCIFVTCNSRCPTGAIQGLSDTTCYKIAYFRNGGSFFFGEEACQKEGGHLVSIHNAFENAAIFDIIQVYPPDNRFWIGGTNQLTGDWSWTDGTSFGYKNWAPGQPTTGGACVQIENDSGLWEVRACEAGLRPVCKVPPIPDLATTSPSPSPPHGTHCMNPCQSEWVYYPSTRSCFRQAPAGIFYDVLSSCQRMNASLVSIHDVNQNRFIAAYFGWQRYTTNEQYPWIWIGMYDPLHCHFWEWTDGSPVNFVNWYIKRPDGDGYCVLMPRMSSILTVPVEVLMDVFRANDPADKEALQLTCRHFHGTIMQNLGTLPTRLVCELAFDGSDRVHLYRAPANSDGNVLREPIRESIARSRWPSLEIQEMYEMFGRKTAIRKVEVYVNRAEHAGRLTRLIENFPSVKCAVSLVIDINTASVGLPADPVLDYFERLETIGMRTRVDDKDPSFWSALFATRAFRRVPMLRMVNTLGQFPAVGDLELFDFITDCSHMPAAKPRVVHIALLDGDSVDALERRFNENIDSIGGHVCAVIKGHGDQESRCLTNMAVGSQKKLLAEQLLGFV
ncbi:Protein CLEC-51 [Aphelenchoides avenae]|nr:Protein CLEC-51 [Aphelenchus avenae]